MIDNKVVPVENNSTAQLKSVAHGQQAKAKQYKTEVVIKKVTSLWNKSVSFAQKSLNAYIECGEYLLEAKEHMDPDDFTTMLRGNALPFDESKACRLMQVARNPVLVANAQNLPNSWTALRELARLDTDTLERMFEEGDVTSETTSKELKEKTSKSNKGAGSFGRNGHTPEPDIAGSKATEKAKLILKAAALLKAYSDTFDDKAESAVIHEFSGMAEALKFDVIEGLRWAIELHDWLAREDNTD